MQRGWKGARVRVAESNLEDAVVRGRGMGLGGSISLWSIDQSKRLNVYCESVCTLNKCEAKYHRDGPSS